MSTIIKIMIKDAPKDIRPEYKQPCLKDRVMECCRAVESNQIDSKREWNFLKKVYEKLSRKQDLSKVEAVILDKLEDLMIKYGKHDPSDSVDLDAQFMNRGDKGNG